MSDMNAVGHVLANMSDNLNKIRVNLLTSFDRVSVEREMLIKSVHAHYDNIGEILMFHIREIEKLQGIDHTQTDIDPNPRFNNNGRD